MLTPLPCSRAHPCGFLSAGDRLLGKNTTSNNGLLRSFLLAMCNYATVRWLVCILSYICLIVNILFKQRELFDTDADHAVTLGAKPEKLMRDTHLFHDVA